MNNMEQVLRLLEELERLDQASAGSTAPAVTSSALLKTLIESEFHLTTAILGVRSDS